MTTPDKPVSGTPRTETAARLLDGSESNPYNLNVVWAHDMAALERELQSSQAECARLRAALEKVAGHNDKFPPIRNFKDEEWETFQMWHENLTVTLVESQEALSAPSPLPAIRLAQRALQSARVAIGNAACELPRTDKVVYDAIISLNATFGDGKEQA